MKPIVCLLTMFWAFTVNAQNIASVAEVRRFEGEIGVGLVFGADKLDFDRNQLGASLHAEVRYNLRRLPLDVGIQAGGTIFHRESDYAGQLKFRSWNIMAVTDYNFRQTKKISFFGGLGLGYASLGASAPVSFDGSQPNWGGFVTGRKDGSFCVMPRVGVEFFHHLRVTLDYKWQEKANRHFDVSIGVVFGGGRKK